MMATAAATTLPSSSSASEIPVYARQAADERTATHDERAAALALRASVKVAAATPTVVVSRKLVTSRRTVALAAATAAPAAPVIAAPVIAPPAGPVVTPAGNSAGYSYGYCTWWVSHKRLIPWHGMAYQWWAIARSYGFAEGSTPRAGAVMVMGAGMAGASAGSGHVAYVESVNANGSFVISEMNWYGSGGGWGKVDYRTLTSMAGILGFIY